MDDDLGSPQSAWWHGASGLPDMDALLGPEGMAAVGDVADEALKLDVLLRERFAATGDEGFAGLWETRAWRRRAGSGPRPFWPGWPRASRPTSPC